MSTSSPSGREGRRSSWSQGEPPWWQDAVVYQVYPRSFQDADGDGVGDLRGIIERLDHVAALGADAVWLSPFYPSPMADGGYDVANYTGVHPQLGTLEDAEELIAAAHGRGLRVLFDVVPCHTSIEHPWFCAHPDRYVWSDRDGPQNNWLASFGGPAWSRDSQSGRWYLHSFYPEQPDLDWRNPDVPVAFGGALGFWLERGVDGFRVDAIDRLLKDPELRDDPPAAGPPPLPLHPEHATLEHRHSRDAPDIGAGLAHLRAAVGDALLVGEAYLPYAGFGPYLEHLDLCFAFELFHAPWDAEAVRAALAGAPPGRVAWVLSNHDFARLPDRVGPGQARAAALLLLTLPGAVFVYQGDELGMADGPGRSGPPDDRAGRDVHRHPMAWTDDRPHAGFTTGDPWLPVVTPAAGSAAAQAAQPDSPLALYRDLIAARRALGGELELLEAAPGVVAFRRDGHVVAVNLGAEPAPCPPAGTVVRATHADAVPAGARAPGSLAPGAGLLANVAGSAQRE
ncbi:MAG TPA: alpha-amylase family glycosyl hydrolase [Solirubrobacteraceae bacterium]|nr:alpha-amylase family glycosyl hydrolase [Solirubrobacteraceae bacterium]